MSYPRAQMDYAQAYGRLGNQIAHSFQAVAQAPELNAQEKEQKDARKQLQEYRSNFDKLKTDSKRAVYEAYTQMYKNKPELAKKKIQRASSVIDVTKEPDELLGLVGEFGEQVQYWEKHGLSQKPQFRMKLDTYKSLVADEVLKGKAKRVKGEIDRGIPAQYKNQEVGPERDTGKGFTEADITSATRAAGRRYTPDEADAIAKKHGVEGQLAPELTGMRQQYTAAGRRAMQGYAGEFEGKSREEFQQGARQHPDYGKEVSPEIVDEFAGDYQTQSQLDMDAYRKARERYQQYRGGQSDLFDEKEINQIISSFLSRKTAIESRLEDAPATIMDPDTGQMVPNPRRRSLEDELDLLNSDIEALRKKRKTVAENTYDETERIYERQRNRPAPTPPQPPEEKPSLIDRVKGVFSGGEKEDPKPQEVQSFSSERDARSAGFKSGDIIHLKGVGKVRLK